MAPSCMERFGPDKQTTNPPGVIHESTHETCENSKIGDQQTVAQSAMYLRKCPCINSDQTPWTVARSPKNFDNQQECDGYSHEEYQKYVRSTPDLGDPDPIKGVGDICLFPGENIWELPMSQGHLRSMSQGHVRSPAAVGFRLQDHDGDIGNFSFSCPCLMEDFGSFDSGNFLPPKESTNLKRYDSCMVKGSPASLPIPLARLSA